MLCMVFMAVGQGFAHLGVGTIGHVCDSGHVCSLDRSGNVMLGSSTEGESLKHARQLFFL